MSDSDRDVKPCLPIYPATDGASKIISVKSEGMSSCGLGNNNEIMKGENSLLTKQTNTGKDSEDIEVDIVTCSKINEFKTKDAEDPDATEYSSSFADTTSDIEKYSGLSEAEVDSPFCGDSDLASPYGGFSSIFQSRKKKLTNHWRSFIRPLMWRCKWTELKIKESEHQALKYNREIEACEQRKRLETNHSTFEGFCSRSMPFSSQCYRRKANKRRKRKRVEDMTDTTSFLSLHNLFSYLENKKSNADGTGMVDDFENTAIMDQRMDSSNKFDINEDQLHFQLGDGNNSLEMILWKIEIVHSRVQKLKKQLEAVMSKHAAKFSSSENLSLLALGDAQTSSGPSPTFSAGNGEAISVGPMYNTAQHIPGYDLGDLVVPEIAMSNYGEDIHVPDIIESTVGLLSAADVTMHGPQPLIGDPHEDIVDNVLIHNEGTDGDRQTYVGTSNQLIEKYHEPEKGEVGESTNPYPIPTPTSEPEPSAKSTASQEKSALRSCLASDFQIPRNKRSRGERKSGSVGWNKKGSGEPDSQ